MDTTSWKIRMDGLAPDDCERLSDMVQDVLGDDVQATALDIVSEKPALWRIEFYGADGADPDAAYDLLSKTANREGPGIGTPEILWLEQQDWVAKVQSDLAPVRAGRFFVHGSHDRHRRPPGGISVEIDAAQAFGTGHHATTQGCLCTLDRVIKSTEPGNVLDVGCGSGILAIAAARALRRPVIAADIDPLAVRIAQENARHNGVGDLVRTAVAAGTAHRLIRQHAPYDLVFANILARPLEALAPQISRVLAPGGRAILSGLTSSQETRVIRAYRMQNLRLERVFVLEGWSTLLMSRS